MLERLKRKVERTRKTKNSLKLKLEITDDMLEKKTIECLKLKDTIKKDTETIKKLKKEIKELKNEDNY